MGHCKPSDGIRLRRIINNPPRKIGAKTLEHVADLASMENTDDFSVIQRAGEYPDLARARTAWRPLQRMIESLQNKAHDLSFGELYDALLEESGYLRMLRSQENIEAQTRIENVMELKSNIVEFESTHEGGTLLDFLEEVALFTDIDRYDEQADAVTLMTMHSAKGLEFDTVFLCGYGRGHFPLPPEHRQ